MQHTSQGLPTSRFLGFVSAYLGLVLQSCGPATQWKTTKMGKNGKNVENLSRSKMGKKWPKNCEKNGRSGQSFIFSVFFGHFFPIFDRDKFSTCFSFFPPFCRSARFPLCSRPARLPGLSPVQNIPYQNSGGKFIPAKANKTQKWPIRKPVRGNGVIFQIPYVFPG